MRQDIAREKVNRAKKAALKVVLKKAQTEPNPKNLSAAFSALDKAAKVGLIPKQRADRKKSRLNKNVAPENKTAAKTRTKTAKKAKPA